MNNRIINLKKEQTEFGIDKLLHQGDFKVITLNGNEITDKSSFFSVIEKELEFPESCNNLFARFDDWITDLSWIESNIGICIIVEQSEEFLSSDPDFKENLIEDFEEDILPYWENEVCNVMKDGIPRRFFIVLK